MATNKNATIRYQALNRCFRNPGRKYYVDDLIEACNEALLDLDPNSTGIKRRQFYDDIKFMKDSQGYNAPIESFKDGRKAYYRYGEKDFSINSQPLNEQEAQQLKESLLTLSRFKGMPQFDWVEEIKVRLEQTFNLKTEENILSFEDNPFLTGQDYIGILYNAIINKQVVIIEYKPFKTKNVIKYELHPYHLKQYNNRWFLWGLNNEISSLTNIALDRIQSISESKITFKTNEDINFSEYFDDIIGVSVNPNQESHKILLRVDNDLYPYIKTKPLHGSQKTKNIDENHAIIELELQFNYELEALILSYGEKLEVVEPIVLREQLKQRIIKLNKKYL